jgi:hypothetical protein
MGTNFLTAHYHTEVLLNLFIFYTLTSYVMLGRVKEFLTVLIRTNKIIYLGRLFSTSNWGPAWKMITK